MQKHCTQCGEAQDADARFCPRCGTPQLAGAPAPAEDDKLVGTVIADRYLLVERIGRGASGTIYRGEHTTLRKKVAVKILHPQLSRDDTALERFRREATTVGQLDNDHILQVLDFGRADKERLFFAMEFLDGETVSSVLDRENTLAVPRVLDILTQTGEALIEAHGLGYIHRDLRPRNVFLIKRRGRADFVKLLDFGLAKLILPEAEAKQTAMGMTFGDPRYMSPEQARGDVLDRRADIYSLGAVAFEMLTGQPPYSGGGTFEVLKQHLDAPVPRVRDFRSDCPEWLDAVVQKALAKKPDDRFHSVVKLLDCVREHRAPSMPDADERAGHATLSASSNARTIADTKTLVDEPKLDAPKAEAPKAEPAKIEPAKPAAKGTNGPSAHKSKETMFMGSSARTSAKPKEKKEEKEREKAPKKSERAEIEKPTLVDAAPPESTSGEMTTLPAAAHTEPTIPSVVVEAAPTAGAAPFEGAPFSAPFPADEPAPPPSDGEYQESTAPAEAATAGGEVLPSSEDDHPTASMAAAAPLPPPPIVSGSVRGEPTGEWFDREFERAPGAVAYDEQEEELPKKNRGGMIIAAVSVGLLAVGAVVFALLPKPEHKPVRGEQPAAEQTAVKAPEPTAGVLPSATETPPAAAAPTAAAPTAEAPAAPLQPSSEIIKAPEKAKEPEAAKEPAKEKETEKEPEKEKKKPAIVAKEEKIEAKKAEKLDKGDDEKSSSRRHSSSSKESAKSSESAKSDSKSSDSKSDKKVSSSDKKKLEGFKDPFATPAAAAPAPAKGDSSQAEFFVKLGKQKLSSSDFVAAAANFNKAREYDSHSADAFAGLGEVAFEQGDYNGAAVHLKQALRLSPNRPRFLVLLGQAYYKMNRAKDAVEQYKKALRIDPNNHEALRSLEVAERKLAQGG